MIRIYNKFNERFISIVNRNKEDIVNFFEEIYGIF